MNITNRNKEAFLMKRLISILLSLFLVLASFSGVYAKPNNGKVNGKSEQAKINQLKKELKKSHKDKQKREELIREISKIEKQPDDKTILVFVNGEEVEAGIPPVIKSGRILLPVAPITKALGASLKYDTTKGTVTITKGSTVVVIMLQTGAILVNGKEVKLETPASSINNRVYVPISFIKKIFKHKVDVDDDSDSVIIEEDDFIAINDNVTGTGNEQFEYVGDWNYTRDERCYSDDNHWTSSTNAYFQVRFQGTQVKFYAAKDTTNGIAAVSIDGGTETSVDLYATGRQDEVLVFTSPVLANGDHILKVRVTGTRNTSAISSYVSVDRVEIKETTETVPAQTTVSYNDSITGTSNNQFMYSDGWSYAAQAGAYLNDIHYSNITNAYTEVKFSGTQIKFYGAKDTGYGIAAVSIDGGSESNVDLYAGSRTDNAVLFVSPVLANGQHTLKIRVTGTKNANAVNYYVGTDRVEITGTNLIPPPGNTTPSAVVVNNSETGTANNQFNYYGTWTQSYQTGSYLSDYHWSATTDSYVDIKFEGKQIKLYGSKDSSYGIASVMIDGTVETSVDMYASSHSDNVLLYTSPLMVNGAHTLRIKVTGTKNSNSSNYIIAADKVEIFSDSTTPAGNLALNKQATASSSDDTSRSAGKAVDGKMDTNWYSQYSDSQWISVDLGTQYAVSKVKLYWETAYGKTYSIQVSTDGSNWSSVYSTTNSDGGLDEVTFAAVNARYIKLAASQRATQWGYSLKELEVY
jgi:hypothetical protein